MRSISSAHIGLLASIGCLLVACGTTHEPAWQRTLPPAELRNAASLDRSSALALADSAWAERLDEVRLREAIGALERATQLDTTDAAALARLARAYYFLGDGHLSFDPARHEEMMDAFERGTDAAERALVAQSPSFAARMRSGARIEEAVELLGRDAVPALYWRAANLGKWAAAQGFATLLTYKDEIRATMARCLELDAMYFHAGPHRYFGAFYARAPSFAGGDLARSREHFEQSIRSAPTYLATRVLFAHDYAVKADDRALFESELRAVIAADPAALPSEAAENAVEQRKARLLLAEVAELFD